MTQSYAELCQAARRFGALGVRVKLASSVPGLATPAEMEADARAQRLVPVPMTGPLAHLGYAEAVNSPGAMPAPPPPSNGVAYSPEEQALIMRVALGRMGGVMRDRVDRDTLAAGGHLRVASAPWTSPVMAEPNWGDEGRRPGSATTDVYRSGVDPFELADAGAGLRACAAQLPPSTASRRALETYTADAFAHLSKMDASKRAARMLQGPDPLADKREQQRMWGRSATEEGMWGPSTAVSTGEAVATPSFVIGAAQ